MKNHRKAEQLLSRLPESPYVSVFKVAATQLRNETQVEIVVSNRGNQISLSVDQASNFLAYMNIYHDVRDGQVYVDKSDLVSRGIKVSRYPVVWVLYQTWREKYPQGLLVPTDHLSGPAVPVFGFKQESGDVLDMHVAQICNLLLCHRTPHGFKDSLVWMSKSDLAHFTPGGDLVGNRILYEATMALFLSGICPSNTVKMFAARSLTDLHDPVTIRVFAQVSQDLRELEPRNVALFLENYRCWYKQEGDRIHISRQSFELRLKDVGAVIDGDTVTLLVKPDWNEQSHKESFQVHQDQLQQPLAVDIKGSKMESCDSYPMTVGQVIQFLGANGIFYALTSEGQVIISMEDFAHYTPGGDRVGTRALFLPK